MLTTKQKRLMRLVGTMFWSGAVLIAFDTFDIMSVLRRTTTKEPIFGGTCPALVGKKKGVYADPTKRGGFHDTVILTASNHQFITFYENWRILAEGHGLQHILMSMDQVTHDRVGDDQSILLPSNHQIESAGGFRTPSYNALVCNKIRMVLEILDTCNVSVVFSDADNVLLRDPFQHDLGDMIKSDKIDYIYQSNDGWTENAREAKCTNKGEVVYEGNTGFHFMKPTAHMKQLLTDTLEDCDIEGNKIDDQSLLWARLKSGLKNGTAWEHCPAYDALNGTAFEQLEKGTKGYICCLDPHYYPTGQLEPANKDKKDMVTLHANFWPASAAGKIEKLHSFSGGLGWRLPGNIEVHKIEAGKKI